MRTWLRITLHASHNVRSVLPELEGNTSTIQMRLTRGVVHQRRRSRSKRYHETFQKANARAVHKHAVCIRAPASVEPSRRAARNIRATMAALFRKHFDQSGWLTAPAPPIIAFGHDTNVNFSSEPEPSNESTPERGLIDACGTTGGDVGSAQASRFVRAMWPMLLTITTPGILSRSSMKLIVMRRE